MGGFSLGFIQAGWEVVAACDNDPYAAITYLYNLGSYPVQIHYVEADDEKRLDHAVRRCTTKRNGIYQMPVAGANRPPDIPGVGHFWFGDIHKVTGKEILDALGMEPGEVDCVIGSPPCQGFSRLNTKRNAMDPRNSLVFDFARLVLEIRPKSVMMENVPGILDMVTPEGLPVVDAFCRVLEDGGFGTFEALSRSLLQTSGAGAALRSAGGKSKQSGKIQSDAPEEKGKQARSQQPVLFR